MKEASSYHMAGEDTSVNGVAPHNLQLEDCIYNRHRPGTELLDYLNNADAGDGLRERITSASAGLLQQRLERRSQ